MKLKPKTQKSLRIVISFVIVTILLLSMSVLAFDLAQANEEGADTNIETNSDEVSITEGEELGDLLSTLDSSTDVGEVGEPVNFETEEVASEPVNFEAEEVASEPDNFEVEEVASEPDNFEVEGLAVAQEDLQGQQEPKIEETHAQESVIENQPISQEGSYNNLRTTQFPQVQTIENTFTIVENARKVQRLEKVWVDSNDDLRIRPAEVQVSVTGPNNYNQTITLNASNGWSHEWAIGALSPGTYTVVETVPEHYTVSYAYGDPYLDVYESDETVTSGETWNFSDLRLNYPNYIAVKKGNVFTIWTRAPLANNGEFLTTLTNRTFPSNFNNMIMTNTNFVSGAGNFTNSDLGVEITLSGEMDGTITFNDPSNWSLYIFGQVIDDETIIITNTLVNPTVNVEGTKTWIDDNNAAGHRPSSIDVTVKGKVGNDVVYQNTKTITGDDWSYSWTDLPLYQSGGGMITYTIEELSVPYYETSQEGYNLTNTLKTVDVTIDKIVKGNFGDYTNLFDFTLISNMGHNITFELAHSSEPKVISNIPPNTILTLTEESGIYDVTIKVGATSIGSTTVDGVTTFVINLADFDNEDITIEVTNRYDITIETGIYTDSLPFIAILTFSLTTLSIMFTRKRIVNKNNRG